MALTTEREKKICDKYGARDDTGHVHCNECPLQKGDSRFWDFRCKANSSYNRHTREWELEWNQQIDEVEIYITEDSYGD